MTMSKKKLNEEIKKMGGVIIVTDSKIEALSEEGLYIGNYHENDTPVFSESFKMKGENTLKLGKASKGKKVILSRKKGLSSKNNLKNQHSYKVGKTFSAMSRNY